MFTLDSDSFHNLLDEDLLGLVLMLNVLYVIHESLLFVFDVLFQDVFLTKVQTLALAQGVWLCEHI